MRIAHSLTTYGKEIYKYNFYTSQSGLISDGNNEKYALLKILDMENNSNRYNKEFKIFIIKAENDRVKECPIFFKEVTGNNVPWPQESGSAQFEKDYKFLMDNAEYRIQLDSNGLVLMHNAETSSINTITIDKINQIHLSNVDIIALENDTLYKVYICDAAAYSEYSYCSQPDLNGNLYNIEAFNIYSTSVNDGRMFIAKDSLNDYFIYTYATSEAFKYIPGPELVLFNEPRSEYNLPQDRMSVYIGDEPERFKLIPIRTKLEDPDKYAYNIYSTVSLDQNGWINEEHGHYDSFQSVFFLENRGRYLMNADFTSSGTNDFGDFFIPWFYFSVYNQNSPVSVDILLNNISYHLLDSFKLSDAKDAIYRNTEYSVFGSKLQTLTYSKDINSSKLNFPLQNLSPFKKNVITPFASANINSFVLINNIFYDISQETTFSGGITTKNGCILYIEKQTAPIGSTHYVVYVMAAGVENRAYYPKIVNKSIIVPATEKYTTTINNVTYNGQYDNVNNLLYAPVNDYLTE